MRDALPVLGHGGSGAAETPQPDVVCLSANDWTSLPTSKQHLMSVLSRSGRVLYVDPPLDLASVLGRPRRWPKLARLRRTRGGPWVFSPILPVHPSSPEARAAFHRRSARAVRSAARRAGIERPVVWAFSPEHAGAAGLLGERLLVYHAADDPASMSRHPEAAAALEARMLSLADLVFVSSQALLESRRAAAGEKVHRLPNAADRRHFARVLCGDHGATSDALLAAASGTRAAPPGLPADGRPVVLYGGAAYAWFDWELLARAAELRPDWLFALVGPTGGRARPAGLPANVVAVGRRPYEQFPRYVAAAGVAVLPWRDCAFSANADPIVLYEYLLCGKPVVATPFPAALERGPLVRTASGPEAFVAACDDALSEPAGSAIAAARARFAFANSWEDRAATALARIGAALLRKSAAGGGGRSPGAVAREAGLW
jgi:glycosyltransferase involved in cell wall biosynthesis